MLSHSLFFDPQVLELVRRIALTGLVLTIPPDREAMRLLAGALITVCFLCALCLLRPYKRDDNNTLAITANSMLLSVLLIAIFIKLHHDVAEKTSAATAADILGFDDSFAFSLALALLTCTLLLSTILLMSTQAMNFRKQRLLQVTNQSHHFCGISNLIHRCIPAHRLS